MRDKVTFPPNLSQVVDLQDPAVLAPGQYGDQYQYILGNERIMWVEPTVHQQIVALGASRGDTIAITKTVTPSATGGRAKTAWTVERVEDEPAHTATPAPAPAPKPPQPAAALAAGIDDAERWPELAAPRRAPQPISAPAPAAAPQPASEADSLLNALTTACDVAALAEKHAARIGFPLHFEAADIRALASGLMIERRDRSTGRRAA